METDTYENSKIFTKRYKKIKALLKMVFGYDTFKPVQYEIINKIVSGQDVCAILPTGYGKSLTFQLSGLYLDKITIVICPLISLMDDQCMILEKMGISVCCFNSTSENKVELRKNMLMGMYKFIYISPEGLSGLKDLLVSLEKRHGIALIAIDEAHCISSYGFQFRPAYRDLSMFKKIFPETPILAVTATATESVAKDICKVLGLGTDEPIKTSFDRPNLYLECRLKSHAPQDDIIPILEKYPRQPIIIYCIKKAETEKLAEILKIHKYKCGVYHGGMDPAKKEKTHHDFIDGKISIVVATIAFGMGINKSNVRVVVHYGAPRNLEGYYQEIGRAGRDGEKAYCFAFFAYNDFRTQESFIEKGEDIAYKRILFSLLEIMKRYLQATKCRRHILLEYFDEETDETCGFCDNCLGVKKVKAEAKTTDQDVKSEAKMIIDLIESLGNRSFGLGMYIDILRGSNNKKIDVPMRKNKFYSKGKHRSVGWWKEMTEHLINLGYLQHVHLKSKFSISVIKATSKGISWSSRAELGELLEGIEGFESGILPKIKMVTIV